MHIEKFLFFPYAKHRNCSLIFVKIKQKLFYEAKIAFLRFLQIISLALFFIRKKRAVKEAEKRAVLSLCQCVVKLKASASPAVTLSAFGGTARRKNDLRILCKRIVEDACPTNKSVNHKNAPWFRAIFALAKMGHGEAQEVLV